MTPVTATKKLLPALLIAAFSVSAVAANAGTTHGKGPMGQSPGSMALHQAMAKDHPKPMHMSGDVDRDFAMMMSMHHQQAIAMVDVLARHGKNPELKAMAAKMKAAQAAEIKQLARFAGPMDHRGMAMGHGKTKVDHRKMAAADFARFDQNRDGKLTLAEIAAADPLRAHFPKLDANGDGSLDKMEFGKHHGL